MKLLMSAYACAPNHGSDYATGWNWTTGAHSLVTRSGRSFDGASRIAIDQRLPRQPRSCRYPLDLPRSQGLAAQAGVRTPMGADLQPAVAAGGPAPRAAIAPAGTVRCGPSPYLGWHPRTDISGSAQDPSDHRAHRRRRNISGGPCAMNSLSGQVLERYETFLPRPSL